MASRSASSTRSRPGMVGALAALGTALVLLLAAGCDGEDPAGGPAGGAPHADVAPDARSGDGAGPGPDADPAGDGAGPGPDAGGPIEGLPPLEAACLEEGGGLELGPTVELADAPVTALAFGPDGGLVVAAEDGRVELLRHPVRGGGGPDEGGIRFAPDPTGIRSRGEEPTHAIDFAPDGNELALGTADGRVLLRQTPAGDTARSMTLQDESEAPIRSVSVAPGAEAVAAVDEGFSGHPTLWRVEADERLTLETYLWEANDNALRASMPAWDGERTAGEGDGRGWSITAGHDYGIPLVEAHPSDGDGGAALAWWPEMNGRIVAFELVGDPDGPGAGRMVALTGRQLASAELAPDEEDREPPIASAEGVSMLGGDELVRPTPFDGDDRHVSLGLTRLGDRDVLLSVGAEGRSFAFAVDGLEPLDTLEHEELTAMAAGPEGGPVVAGDADGRVHAVVCAP